MKGFRTESHQPDTARYEIGSDAVLVSQSAGGITGTVLYSYSTSSPPEYSYLYRAVLLARAFLTYGTLPYQDLD